MVFKDQGIQRPPEGNIILQPTFLLPYPHPTAGRLGGGVTSLPCPVGPGWGGGRNQSGGSSKFWVWGELENLKVTEGTNPVGVLDRSPQAPSGQCRSRTARWTRSQTQCRGARQSGTRPSSRCGGGPVGVHPDCALSVCGAGGPLDGRVCAAGESGCRVCTWVMCAALVVEILRKDLLEGCTM